MDVTATLSTLLFYFLPWPTVFIYKSNYQDINIIGPLLQLFPATGIQNYANSYTVNIFL